MAETRAEIEKRVAERLGIHTRNGEICFCWAPNPARQKQLLDALIDAEEKLTALREAARAVVCHQREGREPKEVVRLARRLRAEVQKP